MNEKAELTEIVEPGQLLADDDILNEFSGDSSFVPRIRPEAIVKLHTAEQVREIVRWANRTLTPLVPVSSGPPRFHGDTVPSVGGAVVVDLSGMKQIIRVDRRNRVAMIEPGVTFGELIPALKEKGLAPLLPLVPRSSKSVVTSFLERTPITIPRFHWEPQDPLLCVEVIYGTGDALRTGSASGPGTIEEQWEVGRAQMRGMGPSQVDFTRLLQGAQGTMGIVVWATVRCRPMPKIKRSFLVASEDVAPLIELAYGIMYKKLGEELLILNNTNLASMLGHDSGDIDKLRSHLPPWILILGIDGAGLLPQEKVSYQIDESLEVAQSCGLELKTAIPGARADDVSEVLSQPSEEPYWMLRRQGGCHDLFFLTTLDRCSAFLEAMYDMAGRFRFPADGIGIYIQPTVQGTNCHLEFDLGYNPESQTETEMVRRFAMKASETLANRGAFFSRPYGPWARIAYGREGMTVIGQRKLKNIFDANGIMNPGKLCF